MAMKLKISSVRRIHVQGGISGLSGRNAQLLAETESKRAHDHVTMAKSVRMDVLAKQMPKCFAQQISDVRLLPAGLNGPFARNPVLVENDRERVNANRQII